MDVGYVGNTGKALPYFLATNVRGAGDRPTWDFHCDCRPDGPYNCGADRRLK